VECYYSIPWNGAIVVPLNNRWSVDEIAYAVRDSGAACWVVHSSMLEIAKSVLRTLDKELKIVVIRDDRDDDSAMDPEHFCYEALIRRNSPAEVAEYEPESVYAILYTGGTTGVPKGVMLASRGLWANALFIAREYDYCRDDTALHVAPMFHMAAAANLFAITSVTATHVIAPAFVPENVIRLIESEKVKHLPLVPSMMKMLLDEPSLENADISSVERVVYGAAPMSGELLAKLRERLPDVQLLQVYGQTEMSPVITTLGPACHDPADTLFEKRESVGQVIYGTELRIIDRQGNALGAGSRGEIAVRGPGCMLGYWNRPEETSQTLVDGWVRTGDVGRLDSEGYLYIEDRCKDMIISGGENVYSIEVESVVTAHPEVTGCAVIGIPDEKWGERVHAVITTISGKNLDVDDLRAFCKNKIAAYKCPTSVEVVDALPLSAAGKVLKTELRRPYWAGKKKNVN